MLYIYIYIKHSLTLTNQDVKVNLHSGYDLNLLEVVIEPDYHL